MNPIAAALIVKSPAIQFVFQTTIAMGLALCLAKTAALTAHAQDLDPQPVAEWKWGPVAEIRDGLAYCGGRGLTIVDVRDPAHPQQVGHFDTDGSYVFISGKHAFVVAGRWDVTAGLVVDALTIVYIRDPANPVRLGGYDSDKWLLGGSASGNHVYLIRIWNENGRERTEVLAMDVSDPTNPQPVGSYETVLAAHAIVASDQYVYVAENRSAANDPAPYGLVEVIDISDPANPQPVGRYETIGKAQDIAVSGDYAYVAASTLFPGSAPESQEEALLVLDISNPADPRKVDTLTAGETGRGTAGSVSVSGNYALLTRGDSEEGGNPCLVLVIDIKDPSDLRRVGAMEVGGPFAADGFISGNYAYVSDGWVFDISKPATLLSLIPTESGCAIQWDLGTLQFAPTMAGPWTDLPAASPMPLSPIGEKGFFRVKVEERAR